MFDIGFWELSVIGVVALVVVGPDKLPGLARQAGRMAGRAQRMAGELRREFEREAEFQELKKLQDAIKGGGDMEAAAKAFQTELSSLAKVDPTATASKPSAETAESPAKTPDAERGAVDGVAVADDSNGAAALPPTRV